MATFLQTCLLLGVFTPLASFVFLAFFGTRLPRPGWLMSLHHRLARDADEHAGGPHGHGPGPPDAAVHAHRHGSTPGEPLAGWIATAAIGMSLLLAILATFAWGGVSEPDRDALSRLAATQAPLWVTLGSVPIRFGVRLDSLTVIVFLMVTLCATCIHVFSVGYMKGDPRFARFFTFLSLFCFSMLGLVISTSLLFLFVFWELVGVCSYFLIGFWFEKKSASNAAIKAFVVNRVGDFGFVIGVGLCFAYLGDLSLDGATAVMQAGAHRAGVISGLPDAAVAVAEPQAARAAVLFSTNFAGVSLATWLGLMLFCGAIGKSAQFPLQVWLPDAMEGPTPVSALIHAATMVAAGVYLVARIFLLLTPAALDAIAVVGCITLTMAALIAIVQTDIKRVLAYSTLSQLGYMIFGLGIGAWVGAMFHLLVHAFFKALLFLGAGQVIAGCHHEQDLRRMGGLGGKMPRTTLTFLVAVLAIAGAGIPFTPMGLGSFYSKDEILAVANFRHHEGTLSLILYLLPVAVAYITPFYMGRCFILAFLGKPRDSHVHEHAHESPLMYRPLLVLAALTLIAGVPIWIFRSYVVSAAPEASPLAQVFDGRSHEVEHAVHTTLVLHVGLAFAVGLGLAWWLYRDGLERAAQFAKLPWVRPVHTLLSKKFYFDEIYGVVFVGGSRALAYAGRLFDTWIIDGIVDTSAYLTERISRFSGVVVDNMGVDGMFNGLAAVTSAVGGALRRVQTGLIRNYILIATAAVAAALIGWLWSPSAAAIALLVLVLALVWPFVLNAPSRASVAGLSPAGARVSPMGATVSPVGAMASPAGAMASPVGAKE
ncbi:NADH-quinone oxidoreductase subunit L [Phycisphaerae bacterium RAS1]|nr:NADH-quinone oxidoreductase subunit L [Phycisphaerae bacterium RAS1]